MPSGSSAVERDSSRTKWARDGSPGAGPLFDGMDPFDEEVSPTSLLELTAPRPVLRRRMHNFFEASCDRTPQAVALEWETGSYSYAELDARANAMAHYLRDHHVVPGGRVALFMPRSPELYVALLAIMKAGAAFVPIDPASPADRVAYVAGDSGAGLILASTSLNEALAEATVPSLLVDQPDVRRAIAGRPATRLEPDDLDNPTAYIIYTSGSSGRPKGVDIRQTSICNFIHVITQVYDVRDTDRVYQGMTIAFDFAIEEVWPTWAAGATLVAGPTDGRRLGAGLTAFLEERRITLLYCVPTVLSTLERTIDSIRALMVGGEACPAGLVERWAPGRRMLNTYGPTEATVTCVWSVLLPGRPVTIGIPVPTYTAIILDDDGAPVPTGEVGELCIGGPGVALGYVNRPELTRERFIPHPNGPAHGRIYRTGDLAKTQPDGEIVYLGRADAEVKIRGHRVDLGEIESVMMRDPLVSTAAVTLLKGGSGDLAAFITTTTPLAADVADDLMRRLMLQMRETLPPYMVPAYMDVVESIPMLPSGKVDRNKLPEPSGPRLLVSTAAYEPPVSGVEEWLAGVWAESLGLEPGQVSATANFFEDLGGHSLVAATLVSALRKDPRGSSLSVMDLYSNPTVRDLAAMLDTGEEVAPTVTIDVPAPAPTWRVWLFGATQLVAVFITVAIALLPLALSYWWFYGEPSLAMAQLLLMCLPVTYLGERWLMPIVTARLFSHRLRPGTYPLYGWVHWRVWAVSKAVTFSPLNNLTGSPFAVPYLRAMGARIHESVHVGSPEIPLPALVRADRGATVGYATRLDAASVSRGALRLGEVHLREDATVAANCVLTGPCMVGEATVLREQSALENASLPADTAWQGSPARPLEDVGDPVYTMMSGCGKAPTTWTGPLRRQFVLGMIALEAAPLVALLPVVVLTWMVLLLTDVWWGLWYTVLASGPVFVVSIGLLVLFLRRYGLSSTPVGVHHLRSKLGVEKWFADKLLAVSLDMNNSLYSTLYTAPWLRRLGARIGDRAEVSTIADIDPDLLVLGDESFIADMASVGSATYCNHHVAFRPTRVGKRAFVGNAAFVPSGSNLGDGSLLGVSSVPASPGVAPGSSWLGSPSFFLPKREIYEEFTEEETFLPPRRLVWARYAIEFVRIVAPASILSLSTYVMLWLAALAAQAGLSIVLLVLLVPALALLCGLLTVILVAAVKWLLVGRYRPRVEALWSLFVRRSELATGLFEAASVPALLGMFTGTPMLGPLLRLYGARIGKNVLMETTYLTEFDLVKVGANSYVGPAVSLQTHLFEDRVMKMDVVEVGRSSTVGARSIVLYGTDVGEGVDLAGLSLIMKGESVPPATAWAGVPAQPVKEKNR